MARHITYDLIVKSPECLANKNHLAGFMLECVRVAGMKILAGPYVIDTGAFDPNPGLTGWTVLTTSHVSIHTFIRQCRAFIDLFSCVEFDQDQVKKVVATYFGPEPIDVVEVCRAAMPMFQEEDNVVRFADHLPRPSVVIDKE